MSATGSLRVDGPSTGSSPAPNQSPGNGLGDGGHRLHEWFMTVPGADHEGVGHPAGVNGEVVDEMMATRAVVAQPGVIEPAGGLGVTTTPTACRSSSSLPTTPTI